MGHSAIVNTTGNDDCHIILRGGKKPNYSESDIQDVKESLQKSGLSAQIMIDFSHANCCKQYEKQLEVAENVANQIRQGEKAIIGVMVESHLLDGNQDITTNKPLAYGKSVTDACIGWQDSEKLLYRLAVVAQTRSDSYRLFIQESVRLNLI